jgi:hypothetical protein
VRPRAPRRLLGVLLVIALVVGGLIALGIALGARDRSTLSTSAGPGQAFPNHGDRHLRPGTPEPAYAEDPPASGAHVPTPIGRDGVPLSNDQLLTALEEGNVVIVYGSPRQAPALRALARSVSGPFDPVVAQTGQAVILDLRPRPTGGQVIGMAWTHAQRAVSPADPKLRAFVSYWLGRGAPSASGGS